MKGIGLILVLGILPFIGMAQLKPDFFPEDLDAWDEQGRCIYCKPGVRNRSRSRGVEISYSFNTPSTFELNETRPTPPVPSFKRFSLLMADMKIPLILKDNFKLLVSYKFFTEYYNIEEVGTDYPEVFRTLADTRFKSNSFGLIVSRPLDGSTFLIFQAKYTSNGNYPGWMSFKRDASIYKFRGLFGVKPHEDFEWGIGINLTQSFRRLTFIPFVIFNKNFNDKWGMESVLPAYAFIRYNLNKKNLLLFGPQYISRSFRFQKGSAAMDGFDYTFNHSELLTSLRWERQLAPWIWANIQVGYQMNFNTDFESQLPVPGSFSADPSDAPRFQFSLFLSPPM